MTNQVKISQSGTFVEPSNLYPSNLTSRENNVFALILREVFEEFRNRKHAQKEGKEHIIPTVYHIEREPILEALAIYTKHERQEFKKSVIDPLKKLHFSQKSISYKYKNENGKRVTSIFHLIRKIEVSDKDVTVTLEDEAIDVLAKYEEHGYAIIDFHMFVRLKSHYAKRLLKDLIVHRGLRKKHEYSVQELRELLGATDVHDRFTKFREVCLDKPLRELVEASSGRWEATEGKGYRLNKKGRDVASVEFCMAYSDEYKEFF